MGLRLAERRLELAGKPRERSSQGTRSQQRIGRPREHAAHQTIALYRHRRPDVALGARRFDDVLDVDPNRPGSGQS
jgi:hypothetical protein